MSDETLHQITFDIDGQHHPVDYRLRRSARARRIGFRIDHQGLAVSVPQRARLSHARIEEALRGHQRWIVEKLGHWQQRRERHADARAQFIDGGQVPLLGKPLRLRTQPHSANRRTRIQQMGDELWISGPAAHDPALLRPAVIAWLKGFARQTFEARTPPLAERLGRSPRSIGLSSARTRWGSCAHSGDIRLNWRLIQFDPAIIDYVIAHELAHLIELNHSPRFWAQVAQLMPDYQQHKAALSASVDAYLG